MFPFTSRWFNRRYMRESLTNALSPALKPIPFHSTTSWELLLTATLKTLLHISTLAKQGKIYGLFGSATHTLPPNPATELVGGCGISRLKLSWFRGSVSGAVHQVPCAESQITTTLGLHTSQFRVCSNKVVLRSFVTPVVTRSRVVLIILIVVLLPSFHLKHLSPEKWFCLALTTNSHPISPRTNLTEGHTRL